MLIVAGALRLLAIGLSDVVPWDGVYRLEQAMAWADRPTWNGLSGVWPPLHSYVLGVLLRVWYRPFFWTHLLGWLAEMGTVYLIFRCVQVAYGEVRQAGWAALFAAVYWAHIWLTPSNYVETYYLFFIFLSIYWALVAHAGKDSRCMRPAAISGLAMAAALLLRHEGLIAAMVLFAFLLLAVRPRAALAFALIALPVMGWMVLEPTLTGQGSYLDLVKQVGRSKARENELLGRTTTQLLGRWVIIPGGTPSVVVVALALFGLWKRRRRLHREVFFLMFVAQAGFYFAMTIVSAWALQIRYSVLYFINLLPYAGIVMASIQKRTRALAVLLLALAVCIQAPAWWYGRNERRPLGWLPIHRATVSQQKLNEWFASETGDRRILLLRSIREWEASVARLKAWQKPYRFEIVYLSRAEQAALFRGEKMSLGRIDLVIADPASPFYQPLLPSLPPGARTELQGEHLRVIRLRPTTPDPGATTQPDGGG